MHIVKRYGNTTAVDRIDLKIAADCYCCLLGPSGCGKTSTLRWRQRLRHWNAADMHPLAA